MRNITEFGLNMYASRIVLCLASHLDRLGTLDEPNDFHLYMVGTRPRISIDPSIAFDPASISGTFLVQKRGQVLSVPFKVNQPVDGEQIDGLRSDWPHSMATFTAKSADVKEFHVAGFASFFPHMEDHCALEIVYVGQAFGEDGERSAVKRLSAHSTLQKILAETMFLEPDKEVWLVALDMQPVLLTRFDGRFGPTTEERERDDERLNVLLSRPISAQHQINFAEAALIKHFSPRFNKHFRQKFPTPEHSSYRDCYDLDYGMLSVEVSSEDIRAKLYSSSRTATWTHMAMFDLHDPAQRASMFDYMR